MHLQFDRRLPLLLALTLSAGAGAHSVAPIRAEWTITGTVFRDANANGKQDPDERGLANVAVSDQDQVVVTNADGRYAIRATDRSTLVFVSVNDGYRAQGPFYHALDSAPEQTANFPLVPAPHGRAMTFIHASDTHISEASLPRTQRLRAIIDSVRPDFVIVTGDLVRDALRVGEAEATSYYRLFNEQAALVRQPFWTVPGNHEVFGIERDLSHVSADHPLYGRAMYHHYRGPDYYSFNANGVHFVALNTVDIDDTRYYGHVDSLQLEWLSRDLAAIPANMPVVTFNHIPFFTAIETVNGYVDRPPAPSIITVNGKAAFRHSVSNAADVLARITPHPYPIALGGHMHSPERLRYEGIDTRFELAGAVVGPAGTTAMPMPSGVTVYPLTNGAVGVGRFVPLGLDKPANSRE